MKLNSNHYESPVLSVLDTEVENGFAASGGEAESGYSISSFTRGEEF